MSSASRIIDANANRAREALRVMEDAARFILDHSELAGDAKRLRHDLAAALGPIEHVLLPARDTPGDVGTAIATPAEGVRTDARAVATAAAKRLSEALRTIEEYAKTIAGGPSVAASVERLRYRAYDLEQRLLLTLPTTRCPQWKLCVLISEGLCTHHEWLDIARAAVNDGADCLQLREKELEAGELLRRCETLLGIARPAGAHVIVNDRPDVALAAGADGVHLGRGDLPIAAARRLEGDRLLIGASTSTIEEARAAQRVGADYCGIGPMFASTTKRKPIIAGPEAVRRYIKASDPPLPAHLAIGGITPENVRAVVEAGAGGLAVSSAVCGATDPGAVVRDLLCAFDGTR